MTISKTYLKRLKKCTKEVQLTKKRLCFTCKQQKCKKSVKYFQKVFTNSLVYDIIHKNKQIIKNVRCKH